MTDAITARVVRREDLERLDLKVTRDGGSVRYLAGERCGLAPSVFESETVPGSGPEPHVHPYAEVFVLHT